MDRNEFYRIELIKRLNYLPMQKEKNNYYSFGQFDYISIKRKENVTDLKDLMIDYNELYLIKENNVSSQIIYGFLEENCSIDFFEKENEYLWNYQMISIVSLDKKWIKYYNDYRTDCLRHIVLNTLDKNTYILISRSTTIKDLIDFISKLASQENQKFNIIYSILSIKNLENNKIENEDICVTINFKIAHTEKFKNFVEQFSQSLENNKIEYHAHYFLGNTDYEIVIPKINSQTFLSYHSKGKLLNNGELDEYIKYMHSHISVESAVNFEKSSNHNNEIENEVNDMLNQIHKLKQSILEIKDSDTECKVVIVKILKLLDELLVYNNSYILTAKFVLPTLYEYIIQKYNNEFDSKASIHNALEELYEEVNNLVVNAIKTGHDPFLFPDFYYSSNKIIFFYLNYLNKLKNVFADKNIRYEFIISPRLNATTQVKSLSKQNDNLNRLLVVHIPVIDLYDLETSLVILTHEAGHFLPNNQLRNRKLRTKILIRNFIVLLEKEITKGIDSTDFVESSLQEQLLALTNDMVFKISINMSKMTKENSNIEFVDYLDRTEKTVKNVIYNHLIDIKDNFYDSIISYKKNDSLSYKLKEIVKKNIERLVNYRYGNNLEHLYLNMERILRECYSDIFAIEVLHLNAENYFKAIHDTADKFTISKYFNSFLLARLSIITHLYHWQNILKKSNNITKENKVKILKMLSSYENEEPLNEEIEYFYGLHDQSVFNQTINYFRKCQYEIKMKMNEQKSSDNLKAYSNFTNNDNQTTKKSIQEQFEFIDKFSDYDDYDEKIRQLKEEFESMSIVGDKD